MWFHWPLLFLSLFFLTHCTLTPERPSEIEAQALYYKQDFVEKLKLIKEQYAEGKVSEALKALQDWNDAELNDNEKGLKYNFVGVILFSRGELNKSIDQFSKTLSFKIDDQSLLGQIHLNLAASYFKTNRLKEAQTEIVQVDINQLKEQEQFKYYHLSYLLNPEDRPNSFTHLVRYLGRHMKLDDLKGDSLFSTLKDEFNRFDDDGMVRFLYNLDNPPNLVEAYLGIYCAEKYFYNGNKSMAQEVMNWMKRRFSDHSVAMEQIKYCDEKMLNFAKMDQKAIGMILPLTGEKSRFAWRALNGMDTAFRLLGGENSFPHIHVRDSQGNEVLGGHQVQELVKQQNVAVIIGGLFPEEAKEEYLKAKKYGAFFISLSPIYLPSSEKDFLLLEVPGSVESIVSLLFTPEFLSKFGKRAAMMYTDDERGQAFMRTFVNEIGNHSPQVSLKSVEPLPKGVNDYRNSVMKFLGISLERERSEELHLMQKIYQLDKKASERSTHTLPAIVDFDWVFLPVFPDTATQVIPLMGYYDAFNVTFVGENSWRSRSVEVMGKRKPLYFLGEDYGSSLEGFKNSFKEKYKNWPQVIEIAVYDALKVTQDILKQPDGEDWKDRNQFHEKLQQKAQLEGATSTWSFRNGRWVKSLHVLKLGSGKLEVII